MTKYINQERKKYWPVSKKLMEQYNDGTHTKKDKFGNLYWRNKNGQLHRDDDKPALIGADGTLRWYQNGQQHRDGDKPAIIDADGRLEWCQNNKLHRLCGPAAIFGPGVICPDGWLEWCINDKDITREVNAWLGSEEWQGTPEKIVEFKLRFI